LTTPILFIDFFGNETYALKSESVICSMPCTSNSV